MAENLYTNSMASILVVEDNRSLYILLRELLESRGHTVTTAENGSDGAACVKKQTFDIVITDIVMPHKSGIELIREIRSRNKQQTKIIAISGGYPQYVQSHLETARIAGANILLPKPFTNKQLIAAVEKAAKETAAEKSQTEAQSG